MDKVSLDWESYSVNPQALVQNYFLIHNFGVFGKVVPLYYGIGGRIKFRKDETRIGVRIPVGVAYDIPSTSINLFLEIVPLLNLNPSTSFTLNGAIGGRFHF